MEIKKGENQKLDHYLLRLTNQDNPILSFIPKSLSLSSPLPLVQKIKIPFALISSDKYLHPLDIIKIKKHSSKIKCLTYWHAGIYLGSGKIFHLEYEYSSVGERSKRRKIIIDDWKGFLRNAYKPENNLINLFAYRSLIPYKSTKKILTQIAQLVLSDHDDYNLLFNNCEHLVNKVIYGINYSPQVQCWKSKLLGKILPAKKINLEKEIIKNDRLIAKLKVQNQAELINKIKEIQGYTQLKI